MGSKVWGYGEIGKQYSYTLTIHSCSFLGDDSHAMLECETEKGFVQNSVYTLQQVKNNIWEVTLEPRNAGDVCQLQVSIKIKSFAIFKTKDVHRFILEKKVCH